MFTPTTVKVFCATLMISGMVFSAGIGEAQLVKAKSSGNAGAAENAKRQQMLKERQTAREAKKTFSISNKKNIPNECTPADVYEGADKAKLKDLILSAWKAEHPQDEVMGVRFIAKDWKANENIHRDDAGKILYINDKAVLVVSVIVKTSPEIATIFPAYVNKENKTGALNAGVQTKTNQYVVKQMLVANYKD